MHQICKVCHRPFKNDKETKCPKCGTIDPDRMRNKHIEPSTSSWQKNSWSIPKEDSIPSIPKTCSKCNSTLDNDDYCPKCDYCAECRNLLNNGYCSDCDYCENCGDLLESSEKKRISDENDSDRYCDECKPEYCPKCDEELNDDGKCDDCDYCEDCGDLLKEGEEEKCSDCTPQYCQHCDTELDSDGMCDHCDYCSDCGDELSETEKEKYLQNNDDDPICDECAAEESDDE